MSTKVFVGNLSFQTKAPGLAQEFQIAGSVRSANIITRGPRSLGYGFVEFENEESAQKAVQLLDKKSIDGRQVNVQVANPRDESRSLGGEPSSRGAASAGGRGRRGGRGGRGGRRSFGSDNGEDNANNGNNNNFGASEDSEGGNRGREGGRGGRGGRGRREGGLGGRRNDESRGNNQAPSTTTLFVSNLPFSMKAAQLAELFKDFRVTKADIITDSTQRSRGYGFVEFSTPEDQQNALNASQGLSFDNRQLNVRVALTSGPRTSSNSGDNSNAQSNQGGNNASPQGESAAPSSPVPSNQS